MMDDADDKPKLINKLHIYVSPFISSLTHASIMSRRDRRHCYHYHYHRLVLILIVACGGSFLPQGSCLHLISPLDAQAVQGQLGYVPPNFHSISARSGDGSPLAIQTYPLHGGAPRRQAKQQASSSSSALQLQLGTPFPTLFWLTHPEISKAIAELERRGYVSILEQRLQNNDNDDDDTTVLLVLDQFRRSHQDYAKRRWECLSRHDQEVLLTDENSSIRRMRSMLKDSGIAGTDFMSQIQPDGSFQASVKCLHAHYGHYRSVSTTTTTTTTEVGFNPVGYWVHELLQSEFPNLIL